MSWDIDCDDTKCARNMIDQPFELFFYMTKSMKGEYGFIARSKSLIRQLDGFIDTLHDACHDGENSDLRAFSYELARVNNLENC